MIDSWSDWPRVTDEFRYRGIDAVFLENEHLRVLVLPGKGGDILEFRDKRTDVDVLWHADHRWVPPASRYLPSEARTTWLDHYPGGWQVNLPIAGFGREIDGNAYGLHGESALVPWEATVARDDEVATLVLETELVRYPFEVRRELRLPAGASHLEVDERVRNAGEVELEYVWQQHVALGAPLVGPAARVDVPAAAGVVEEAAPAFENGRLEPGAAFDWPDAPGRDGGSVDLREVPGEDAGVHDLAFATDLEEGWYSLANPELDLGFGFAFPTDPFEAVWYWGAFGGYHESPYFSRNYTLGLEPTTAYPSGSIPDAQRETGTMKTLGPGETVEASFAAVTYRDDGRVASIEGDGTVRRR